MTRIARDTTIEGFYTVIYIRGMLATNFCAYHRLQSELGKSVKLGVEDFSSKLSIESWEVIKSMKYTGNHQNWLKINENLDFEGFSRKTLRRQLLRGPRAPPRSSDIEQQPIPKHPTLFQTSWGQPVCLRSTNQRWFSAYPKCVQNVSKTNLFLYNSIIKYIHQKNTKLYVATARTPRELDIVFKPTSPVQIDTNGGHNYM